MSLSQAQRAAVERWGQDVCVVAGPGSGKTRVLIERFRWLVSAKGADPLRILAVTFTEKAAAEMKARLIEVFASDESIREAIERAWVSTIHGFCTRLLKEHAIAAGVDPEFSVLDEDSSRLLQERCAEEALDALLEQKPEPMRRLLASLSSGDLIASLLDLYEELRMAGLSMASLKPPSADPAAAWASVIKQARAIRNDPPSGTQQQRAHHQKLQEWARTILAMPGSADERERLLALHQIPSAGKLKRGTQARAAAELLIAELIPTAQGALACSLHQDLYPFIIEALTRFHAAYALTKRTQGVLDFNDLEECAIAVLESDPELCATIRGRFDHILIDELQDINRLQWRLLDLLRRPGRLFAVGDINQSIYCFRHAEPEVFRQYRDALRAAGCIVDELRENYRSRPEILAAINRIVPLLREGVENHRLIACRSVGAPPGSQVEYFCARGTDLSADAALVEARWIARRIRELESSGLATFSEIAVLARTIAALDPIQKALDESGIPNILLGGRSFFESREVRDALAWLQVLANPNDEIALSTVLRSPLVGISDETLSQLKQSGEPLFDAIRAVQGGAFAEADRLIWFRQLVHRQRALAGRYPAEALLASIFDASGYGLQLAPRARANLDQLYAVVRRLFPNSCALPAEIAGELGNLRRIGAEPEACATDATNCVRLMSVHAAKGLEFSVVFLAAMHSGPQNRAPAFCVSEDATLGVNWRLHADTPAPDLVHRRVWEHRRRKEDAEEYRLLYVAMTRARERLIFTAGKRGQADWARVVAEGLGLAVEAPRSELKAVTSTAEGAHVAVTHTADPPTDNFQAPPYEQRLDAVLVHPSSPAEQFESVVAVTALAQFALCPRKYYLAEFLNWPPAARQLHGSSLKQTQVDLAPRRLSDPGVHELPSDRALSAPDEAKEAAPQFLDTLLGQRAARATRFGRDAVFLLECEQLMLKGRIHLWFEEAAELVLVHFPSDLVTPQEAQQAHGYWLELCLNALALERLAGRLPDRAVIFYASTQAAIDVPLEAATIEAARRQVREFRLALHSLSFPLRPGPQCLRCPYLMAGCPAQLAAPALATSA